MQPALGTSAKNGYEFEANELGGVLFGECILFHVNKTILLLSMFWLLSPLSFLGNLLFRWFYLIQAYYAPITYQMLF